MKLIKQTIILLLTAVLFSGCSWWGDSQGENLNQISSVALKSPSADFSQYKYFSITDKIAYIDGEDVERIDNPMTKEVIDLVTANMVQLGYNLVPVGAEADLAVDLSYIINTTTSYYYPSYYWWDWGYYYWDYWGPIYPYYPYYVPPMSSSYSTSKLIIDIADMTTVVDDDKVAIVWHATTKSILGADHTKEQRENAINKCFEILPPQ